MGLQGPLGGQDSGPGVRLETTKSGGVVPGQGALKIVI